MVEAKMKKMKTSHRYKEVEKNVETVVEIPSLAILQDGMYISVNITGSEYTYNLPQHYSTHGKKYECALIHSNTDIFDFTPFKTKELTTIVATYKTTKGVDEISFRN